MKTISVLRELLSTISDAIFDIPPEEVFRGGLGAVRTLWPEMPPATDSSVGIADNVRAEEEEYDPTALSIESIFEHGPEVEMDALEEAFGGDAGEKIKKSIELNKGTDGLAWYVTFHGKGVQWGIYIPVSSIAYLIVNVLNDLVTDLRTKTFLAFRILHQHELFHFAADYMAAQWEAITLRPCYRPAITALKDSELKYIIFEEQLANSHMIRSLDTGPRFLKVPGRKQALRKFVMRQPKGYNQAYKSVQRSAFVQGCEDLAINYIIPQYEHDPRVLDAIDLVNLYPLWPTMDWRYCPIHIVQDEVRFNIPPIELGLFRDIPSIEEIDSFTRTLAALPKQVQISWQKAKTILAMGTTSSGIDFKFWERSGNETIYSVRLNRNYRAHLSYSHPSRMWTAVSVGTHKEMGHG